MLTLRYRQNVKKIVMAVLAVVLLFFVEPALAKKGRNKTGASSRNDSKTQRVERTATSSKAQRSRSVGRSRTKVSPSVQRPKQHTRLRSSKPQGLRNFRKTVKTPSRSVTRRPGIRPDTGKLSRSPFSGRKSAGKRIGRQTIRVDKKSSIPPAGKRVGINKPRTNTIKVVKKNSSKEIVRKSRPIVRGHSKRDKTLLKNHKARKQQPARPDNRESSRKRSIYTHMRPANEKSQYTRPATEKSQHIRPTGEKSQHRRIEGERIFAKSRPTVSRRRKVIADRRKSHRRRRRSSIHKYREHSQLVRHVHRHEHVYGDRRGRICHRIIWPRYRFIVHYNFGRHFAFRYVHPYYHRKYVFISLGGCWPLDYSYIRYYWYGCHPYSWYGYYPIARQVEGDTYNYYTYNYYDDAGSVESGQVTDQIPDIDQNTFADVRERLAQQPAEEPDQETLADRCFEDAVKAFEAGDYDTAAETLAKAIELAPDDMVLPFAYAQALLAAEKYSQAAEVLRAALANISPEKEGVFYPRGLYPDDDTLFVQIDRLAEKAELSSFDTDLQLLLGYQLLGIGEIDEAAEPLQRASEDLKNRDAALILLDLLEKIRVDKDDKV